MYGVIPVVVVVAVPISILFYLSHVAGGVCIKLLLLFFKFKYCTLHVHTKFSRIAVKKSLNEHIFHIIANRITNTQIRKQI